MGKHNSAADAEKAALANQGQINQNLTGLANQLAGTNQQFFQPLLPALSGAYKGNIQASAPGLAQGLQTALNSGGNLKGQTGVDPNTLLQALTQYTQNPGSTNLAGITPQLQSFFSREMTQGINPQVAQNAQSQLSQQAAQAESDLRSHIAPGQNPASQHQDIINALLQNSTNLAGNLAGQSQNFMNQGAQGLADTAQGLDTQRLGMLQSGFGAAQQANQQALSNLLATIGQGQSSLNNAFDFTNQGTMNVERAMNAMAGISNQNAQQASAFGQAAQNQPGFGGLLGGLLGTAGGLMTGGAAGPGGLGSILGGL